MGSGKRLGFLDHLDELRTVFVRVAITWMIGMVACFAFAGILQSILTLPFNLAVEASGLHNVRLSLLRPTEGFVTHMKIAFFAGMIFTSPIVFYHIWSFVSPGLKKGEKRAAFPLLIVGSIMFLVGVAFGYNVLRFATAFFLSFETPDVANQWSLSSYISYVSMLMLAFGIVFQLPLVIFVLSRMGLVGPTFLRGVRRHALITILIFSAVLTPPDPFSQMIMAGPLYLLYELSILISWMVYRKKEELDSATDDSDDPEPKTRSAQSKNDHSGTTTADSSRQTASSEQAAPAAAAGATQPTADGQPKENAESVVPKARREMDYFDESIDDDDGAYDDDLDEAKDLDSTDAKEDACI
jgi:sec-independent protein translocase protein TatC